MYNFKRTINCVLVGTMLVTSLMATGCSKEKANTNTSTSTSISTTPAPEAKANLVWYVRNSKPKNADLVVAKANELIEKKINANVQVNFVEPGDYNNKMSVIMGAGEKFDLCFTSNWANLYEPAALKGAYLPLDDMLAKFPKIKNLVSQDIWNGTKINGKIYGVPNLQLMYDQPGVWLKKDLVDKYKIDIKAIKSTRDLTAVFQKIKDNEPGIVPTIWGLDDYEIGGSQIVGDIYLDTKTWKVFDKIEACADTYKLMREWNQKGFFAPDIATLKDDTALIKSGKAFARYTRQKPGNEAEQKAKYGIDVVQIPLGPMTIAKGSIQSTLTAISTTSKNPEKAMALIELMAMDKDVYNILTFGIEGQDYKKVSDTRIEPITGNYTMAGWMIGNTFNAYLIPGMADDVAIQTKKYNEQAIVDPAVDFCFNSTALTTEIAQMTAVSNEFNASIKYGLDDTDKLMKLRSDKMKTAGRDKVMVEAQKQVDAWRQTKK